MKIIKRYPLSSACIALIWILCFCTPPHTPLDNVSFIDKWTHIAMYLGTCSIIFWEYSRQHSTIKRTKNISDPPDNNTKTRPWRWSRLFLWGYLMPVLMSGVIEILQENCTNHRRSGDWLDFLANTFGASIVLLSVWTYKKYQTPTLPPRGEE